LLTCAHVVKRAVEKAVEKSVEVYWQASDRTEDRKTAAIVEEFHSDVHLDVALLRLQGDIPAHPCVKLDRTDPALGDNLYAYGYPKDYPDGDSVTIAYEGLGFKGNSPLYKLKQGQINSGLSGAALLNRSTGKVCGIVNLSRHTGADLGGRAVPMHVIFQVLPELEELNRQFHQQQCRASNPFDYGKPISSDRFYGRKRAILELKNRIGAISPQCINLVGHRRSGKTSLLRYIQECLEEFCPAAQKPLLVVLDLQNAKFHTPEGILEGVRRDITKQTGTEPWKRENNNDPFEVEDGLQRLVDRGYRLILMLDEFEAIGKRLEAFQDWGDDWRSKASAGLVTMGIASQRPLEEIYQNVGVGSPFGNIFSRTILGALEDDAWQCLVRDGMANADLNWIDDLAGGLPFYVKMAAAMLWQYDDLQEAKNEFIFQATPRFIELWDDLTPPERVVVKTVVSGRSIETNSLTDTLKRYGVLRSGDRLFSSAFAEFVRTER
jgi:Trypsin-like peptidase domain